MIKTSTIGLVMLCLLPFAGRAQAFGLQQENDSLYWLTATGGNKADGWRLTYPVYQFQTGDVDGDGSEDAMVGVIKGTRFYPQKARRLFIFKQIDGHSASGEACKKVRPCGWARNWAAFSRTSASWPLRTVTASAGFALWNRPPTRSTWSPTTNGAASA